MTIAFAYELLKLFVIASMGLLFVVTMTAIFGYLIYGLYKETTVKQRW